MAVTGDLLAEKVVPVTTAQIASAMREAYRQPEWALFFEVGNATGFNTKRHADAVAMNMYPSRGLSLHGFEFKISKSDWKRELADPQKAEEIAQYCDLWSVVAGPGVVGPGELPVSWGLIELVNGKLRTRVAAAKHEAKPLTRSFIAAILRGQAKRDEAEIGGIVRKKVEEARSRDQAHIAQQIEARTKESRELLEKHPVFVEAMRDYRFRYTDEKRFLRAIQVALDMNLDSDHGGLRGIVNSLQSLTKQAQAALADMTASEER